MKVDFEQPLLNLEGQPLVIDGNPLTLKRAVVTALLNDFDEAATAEDKRTRYLLAKRAHTGAADLNEAEVELVKSQVGKFFRTHVVGPVFELLGPAPEPTKPVKKGKKTKAAEAQAFADADQDG